MIVELADGTRTSVRGRIVYLQAKQDRQRDRWLMHIPPTIIAETVAWQYGRRKIPSVWGVAQVAPV